MRAYLLHVEAGFRRYATYRMATAAGAFTNSVFGLLRASILTGAITSAAATSATGPTVGGYTAAQAVTYAWLGQAVIAPVEVFAPRDLAQRVRTGDIAVDLARPIDLQGAWLAADLGRAAYTLLPRSLPPLAVGAVTFGLALPASAWPYLLGALSLLLAVLISFACRFMVNLVAFWLLDVRGVANLYTGVCGLLCGLVIPLAWFPPALATLAWITPFPFLLQVPVDLFTARTVGPAALATIAAQLAWTVALLGAGRIMLARASTKLVVQGG